MDRERKKSPTRNVIEACRDRGRNGYGLPWTEEDCLPAEPTDAVPGTEEKLDVLSRRVENGEVMWSDEDRVGHVSTWNEMCQWIDDDLERELQPRQWRLRTPLLIRVDEIMIFGRKITNFGAWLFVDLVRMTGRAVAVHLRDRDEWASIDCVKHSMDSDEFAVLMGTVGGDSNLAEEIACDD